MRRLVPRPPRGAADGAPPRGRLSRRSVLRGLFAGAGGLGASLWLPRLEVMIPAAYAGTSGFPTRFCLFLWGNGNLPDRWTPTGTGTSFTLSEQLSPLAALQHKICVVSGLTNRAADAAEPHYTGAAALLTGAPALWEGTAITFNAPSIDQRIAAEIGGETLYPSLETAATDCEGMSYRGPNARNPPITDPYELYARLFGDTFVDPSGEHTVDPRLGLRRSALDTVMAEMKALDQRVSSADRVRLELHYDAVRQLELRLARLEEDPPDLAACTRPTEPSGDYGDIDARPQIGARNAIVAEMLAMAFACDQTRVASHFLDDPNSDALFPDATEGHHVLTHNEPGDQPQCNAITTYCVEQFAVLLAALDAIPEGDGTLLDHCAVLGCSEMSEGRVHSPEEVPIVLAGGGDGAFRTGYHLRDDYAGSTSEVMLTLMRVMGSDVASFGAEEGYTESELSEILL